MKNTGPSLKALKWVLLVCFGIFASIGTAQLVYGPVPRFAEAAFHFTLATGCLYDWFMTKAFEWIIREAAADRIDLELVARQRAVRTAYGVLGISLAFGVAVFQVIAQYANESPNIPATSIRLVLAGILLLLCFSYRVPRSGSNES